MRGNMLTLGHAWAKINPMGGTHIKGDIHCEFIVIKIDSKSEMQEKAKCMLKNWTSTYQFKLLGHFAFQPILCRLQSLWAN